MAGPQCSGVTILGAGACGHGGMATLASPGVESWEESTRTNAESFPVHARLRGNLYSVC